MKESKNLPTGATYRLTAAGNFQALINDKPFIATSVVALSCWRAELGDAPNRRIWKIIATGNVARQGTSIGIYIDQSLTPGTYNLINNHTISVVYHLTPRQVAQIYHSRHFQTGCLELQECNEQTKRLRGTFEFGLSSISFKVTSGAFDVQWIDDPSQSSIQ